MGLSLEEVLPLRVLVPTLLSLLLLVVAVLPAAAGSSLIQWHKTWGGSNADFAYAVAIDSSNSVYVTGREGSFAQSTYIVLPGGFLLKYNTSGNLLFQKVWGNGSDYWHQGEGVATDSRNDIYVVGESANASSGSPFRIFLFKFDANGNPLWQRMWWEGPNGSGDSGYGVAVGPNGNIYVAGMTAHFGAGAYDAVLLIFNSTGSLLWQRVWGGSARDEAADIALDSFGEIYVAGSTQSFSGGNSCYSPPCSDAFLLKIDRNGTLVSQNTWGGSNDDAAYGVAADSSGSALVAGYVGEAPPYILGSGHNMLGEPKFNATLSGNDTLGSPSFPAVPLTIPIRTVSGNENYSGLNGNAFLFKYGIPVVSSAVTGPLLIATLLTVCSTFAFNKKVAKLH